MERAFTKAAKKKGWVKEQPMVKEASLKEISLAPSDNVFADMCRLAEALRSKGYVKQAKDLEASIVQYKTAETHLYRVHEEDGEDFLDFAHPEGDFKVGDSEFGVVETELSAHKKIIDVVNKTPTGKLAGIAHDILKAAQFNTGVGRVQAKQGGTDKIANGRGQMVKAIGNPVSYAFTFDNLHAGYLQGSNPYTQYFEGIAKNRSVSNAIKKYIGTYSRVAYGNGPENAGTVLNMMRRSLSYVNDDISGGQETWHKELMGFVDSIAPGKFNQYINQNYEGEFKTAGFSSGGGYSILANKIHDAGIAKKKEIQNSIDSINATMQYNTAAFLNGLSSIEISNDQTDMNSKFSKYTSDAVLGLMRVFMNTFGVDYNVYAQGAYTVNDGIRSLGDHEARQTGQKDAIAHRFSKAADIYVELADEREDISGLGENAQKSKTIASIVSGFSGEDFAMLAAELSKWLPGVDLKDISRLDELSQQWLIAARNNKRELGVEAVNLSDLPSESGVEAVNLSDLPMEK